MPPRSVTHKPRWYREARPRFARYVVGSFPGEDRATQAQAAPTFGEHERSQRRPRLARAGRREPTGPVSGSVRRPGGPDAGLAPVFEAVAAPRDRLQVGRPRAPLVP